MSSVSHSKPVVVIGAGPYGLSTTAHLNAAGVETRIFGEPMENWSRHMPAGMRLRSLWNASHIADPSHKLGLAQFGDAIGVQESTPIPLDYFVQYGQWFQERAVPQLERRRVKSVAKNNGAGLAVELEDGERISASRVILATGIIPFANRPAQFQDLSNELVSHTADHADLGIFRGQRVAIVGGGQSAIESAALLVESGAQVELIMRRPSINWLAQFDELIDRRRRNYAHSRVALGTWPLAWFIALPAIWPFIPHKQRLKLSRHFIRPAGADWLRPRISSVTMTQGRTIDSISTQNGNLSLRLDDGSTRDVNHLLLATGFKIDVGRHPLLSSELASGVKTFNGYPVLKGGFESSVPGLHFLGGPALATFGPVLNHVCGTWAAARGITHKIVGNGSRRAGFTW